MRKTMLRDMYGYMLTELAKKHKNLVVLDGDLATSTKTDDFSKMYPSRFINCGIAEQNMVSVAAGIASAGNLVFVSSFAMFLAGRAYDQIRNSIAYTNQNVKFVATHAGISVGEDGATHQCIEDLALMRVIPKMTVIVPSDAEQTRAAVEYAAAHEGPVYIRLGRVATEEEFEQNSVNLSKSKSFRICDGNFATLMYCGPFCALAHEVAKIFERLSMPIRVVDMPFVKPLDAREVLLAARETGLIVTLEDHSVIGGFGSAVCECVTSYNLENRRHGAEVLRIGVDDLFGKSGSPEELLRLYGFTARDIALKIVLACAPEYVNDISQIL